MYKIQNDILFLLNKIESRTLTDLSPITIEVYVVP